MIIVIFISQLVSCRALEKVDSFSEWQARCKKALEVSAQSKFFMIVFHIFAPYFHKSRQMIRRVSPIIHLSLRHKCYLLVFCSNKIFNVAGTIFLPHCIQDSSCFVIIMNASVVPPAVGSKQERCNTILRRKLSLRSFSSLFADLYSTGNKLLLVLPGAAGIF
jgi:hypothetical protein